jgi:formamidopyrimidine-DNA glycosylase
MPELPDLVYIAKKLAPALIDRRIVSVDVVNPIVLRVLVRGDFRELLADDAFSAVERHGPFLRFSLGRHDLVMHLMLAGRLRIVPKAEKYIQARRFSLDLDDGSRFEYGDEKNMGKVYLCEKGQFDAIPGYLTQGVDLAGGSFDRDTFLRLIAKERRQARVFLMDQGKLSAVGNAYADEILFSARIHPKSPCSRLSPEEKDRFFDAICEVLAWGIAEVEKAGRPTEDKIRDHMRVRNRAGSPCPVCGTIIRKAGVLGFDSFFCPNCQKPKTEQFIDWNRPASGG